MTFRGVLTVATAVLAGCTEPSTGAPVTQPQLVSSRSSAETRSTNGTASVQWNKTALGLVASHNTNSPLASRVYALVSVAQLNATTDAARHLRDVSHPSTRGAVVGASWAVLRSLFSDAASTDLIDAQLRRDEMEGAPNEGGSDFAAGEAIGRTVAQSVLARAATDGTSAADCPATPPGPGSAGFWFDDAVPPNPQPLLPCFGNVRPWLFADVKHFRSDPPPPFNSPAFRAALAEVRHISDTRSAAQLAIVDKWLDGNNTPMPPGRWNTIGAELIQRDGLEERRAARTFALLNMAMMDAHIACWDRKYTFWRLRPWQADSLITTPRGRPHHPANPSGHACAGGAGSAVLGGLFPEDKSALMAMGDEEGFTTVLSGVHYPYDVSTGLRVGREIGALALAKHE
ncbi:MAG: vanadium-dependent haloperoxidase [bacterium]